jgi:NADPH:quinone reductase-like Zn-dependent oxidoreductase
VPCRSPASTASEVLDVVDLPDPVPGDGQQLYEVSSSGVNSADTHHRLS